MAWEKDLIGGKLTEGQGQVTVDVYDRNGNKKRNFSVGGKPISMQWDGDKVKVVLYDGTVKLYSDPWTYEKL